MLSSGQRTLWGGRKAVSHCFCTSFSPCSRKRGAFLRVAPSGTLAERSATCLPLAEREHVRRSEEHTSELQSRLHLVCRLLLEKKKKSQYERSGSYRISEVSFDMQNLDWSRTSLAIL